MSRSITRISPALTWKNQTQVLTGLPTSQHVWTRAERSTFHGLIAPSDRSLSINSA